MGSNDAKEQLEAAKAECVRLERELADLRGENLHLKGLGREHGAWDTLKSQRDAALAVIEKAPHPDNCLTMQNWRAVCNCWKSTVAGVS